jgi:hypothetical protein
VDIFDKEWRAKIIYSLEVAHWRKCWNVRSIIYNAVGAEQENDSVIELSREDILAIIKAIKRINRRNFCNMGSCFWEWDEFKIFNRRNIRNLIKLARMMKKHPEIVPYFYDSY